MTEQPAHSPVRTDPCADCVVGRSPGFPGIVGPGVNGQDSPSVSTLKLLTTTALELCAPRRCHASDHRASRISSSRTWSRLRSRRCACPEDGCFLLGIQPSALPDDLLGLGLDLLDGRPKRDPSRPEQCVLG